MLQPDAKAALINQIGYTGNRNKIVFHDSPTNLPRKNDQAIRKVIWQPALIKASTK